MLRTLKNPSDWEGYPNGLSFQMGGLGTESAAEALEVLDATSESKIAQPDGPVNILSDDTVDKSYFGNVMAGSDMVDGDQSLMIGQTKEWFLTTYDCFLYYDVIALAGEVSIERNVIKYTAPMTPGISGFSVNGKFVPVLVTIDDQDPNAPVLGFVNKPSIVIPLEFDEYIEGKATIRTSSFAATTTTGTETHASTDWQIATDAAFMNIVKANTSDPVNKTTWSVMNLTELSTYYVRARHRGAFLSPSEWSDAVMFVVPEVDTATGVIAKPTVESEVILDPLAGNITFNSSPFSFTISDGTETHVSSDWEVSTTNTFGSPIASIYASSPNRLNWSAYGLPVDQELYVRVRHTGLRLGESSWSDPKSFTIVSGTLVTGAIATPVVNEPLVFEIGTPGVATAESSAFSYTISDGTETHVNSDWEVSTTPSFSNIILTNYNTTSGKVSWRMTGLQNDTTYYVRVRHKGSVLPASSWSTPVSFQIVTPTPVVSGPSTVYNQVTTEYTITNYYAAYSYTLAVIGSGNVTRSGNKIYYTPSAGGSGGFTVNGLVIGVTVIAPSIATPTITFPVSGATNLSSSIVFTSSDFVVVNSTDTHESSSWQVSTDPAFTNVVASVNQSTTNKTTWTATGLTTNTTYYVRMRHHGVAYGASNWSSSINVTTRSSFFPTNEVAALLGDGTHYVAGTGDGGLGIGYKVGISGDGLTAAVACWSNSRMQTLLYIYSKKSGNWTLFQKMHISGITEVTNFVSISKISINADGSVITYGVPAQSYDGQVAFENHGYNYILRLNGTATSYIVQAFPSLGFAPYYGVYNGSDVAISDDGYLALSGEAGSTMDTATNYRVNIYKRTVSGGYTFHGDLQCPNAGHDGERFGYRLALSGDGKHLLVYGSGFGKVWYFDSEDRLNFTFREQFYSPVGGGYNVQKIVMNKNGTVAGFATETRTAVMVRSGQTWSDEITINHGLQTDYKTNSGLCLNEDGSAFVRSSKTPASRACVVLYSRISHGNWERSQVVIGTEKILTPSHSVLDTDVAITPDFTTMIHGVMPYNSEFGGAFVFT